MRSLETPAGTGMRKCVQRTRAGLLVPLALLLSTSCATGTVEAEDRVEAEAKEGGTGTRAEAGEAEEGTRATAAPSAPPARLVAPPARVVAPPAAPANPWIASKAQRGPKQQPNAPWGADLGESSGAEGLALAPPSTRSAQLQQARSFGMIGAMGANAGEAPPPAAGWRYAPPTDRDRYDHFEDNSFVRVGDDPRSTFSIDVDTASLALVRSHLTAGRTPPKGAVRIEELINYFEYSYAEPQANAPFSVTSEVASAPWAQARRLVRIGLKGKEIAMGKRPGSNLVFLIDVSGSMQSANKLPLLKKSLRLLVEQLDERDRVAMVVYAGSSGLALPPTRGNHRDEILSAISRLEAGGSTNGGAGIELAYKLAAEHFVKGGTNRVLLATDGDFNVGVANRSALVPLVQEKAKTGVFLSVLGFGNGNYNDAMLEQIADKGNGNYAYIDTIKEARKVLIEQATGTLVTIAKDVKIQVEFNPNTVEAFRLIGYENRVLEHRDFNDDKKDAGEIGAGHHVTALYEVVPKGGIVPARDGQTAPGVDPLKYQKPAATTAGAHRGELLTVKLRYKAPNGAKSQLLAHAVKDSLLSDKRASSDFQFAAAVAEFGMLLRSSPYRGSSSYEHVTETATRLEKSRKGWDELARLARLSAAQRASNLLVRSQ